MPLDAAPASDRELTLTRVLAAPADKLFKCWTTPELLPQWFCPPPWTVSHAEMDVRTGGNSVITMRGPNGEEVVNPGVYLEVVENQRLVFTDAFTSAWVPSEKPFMVGILTFEDLGDGTTRYSAVVRHWSVADREAHQAMGFEQGWGIAASQMEALAKTL